MSKFIELPNGESLHSETIKAIRFGDPQSSHDIPYRSEEKPRVIVDFVVGDHYNCIVLDCDTVEQRDKLAADLKDEVCNHA